MAHVQLDLTFLSHPKTIATEPLAQLLFIRGLIYAATHLTDGFLPTAAIPQLGFDLTQYARLHPVPPGTHASEADGVELSELVRSLTISKLWHKTTGGYRIHDYLEYNMSKREVNQLIENKKKAGQAGGQARAKHLLQRCLTSATPLLQADSKQNQPHSHSHSQDQEERNPKRAVHSVDNGDKSGFESLGSVLHGLTRAD